MKCSRCEREFEAEDKAYQINEGYVKINRDKVEFFRELEFALLCEKCWKNLAIMLL
ncbi:MAG: hypothetical protein QXJ68_04755 [Methanocellales archaeon]